MFNNEKLVSRDLNNIWHPCSQMHDYNGNIPLIPIKKASGLYLEDFAGNKYLDAISSWWVNIFGHCNEELNDSIKAQLGTLEHTILAGFSHEAIIKLSEKLIAITHKNLNKCFYAENGSTAVEIALKMSLHYWQNTGFHDKTKFVSLQNAYHGETIGAMSVSDIALYKKTYQPLLFETIFAPSPDCFFRDKEQTWYDYSLQQYEKMALILEKNAHEICAVIVEPLVQCASGMRMYHPIYLERLSQDCQKFNIHLIIDEIATGFGRTGTMFASEQAKNIMPDFMCIGKGITSGYLPLAVTLTSNHIYDAFYDEYNTLKGFMHSNSYCGNALACAAAIKTLEIFETKNVITNNQKLARLMQHHTKEIACHKNVAEVRQHGMILAIELIKDKINNIEFDWQERIGVEIYKYALNKGFLLRPLGNVIYFMPPYIITETEIKALTRVVLEGINTIIK